MSHPSCIQFSIFTVRSEACGDRDHRAPVVAAVKALPSHPAPTVPPRILTGDDRTLRATGHSQSCIELSRRGAISSCDCRIQPLADVAPLIGAIIRFVRQHRRQIWALPPHLSAPFVRHLEAGDPACQVVAHWLFAIGLRDHRILLAMPPRGR